MYDWKIYKLYIMNNWTKLFVKSLIGLSIVVSAIVSCADDDALWDKIYDLEARLDSLESNLNNQVAALNALMTDGSTISSCSLNTDGSYVIELSNGTKFTAMPDSTAFSSLVTYKIVNGVKCWATYGADGELKVLTDDSGKAIPVGTAIEVKIVDGVYYLVVNGNEYVTGYDAEEVVQVFSSCTPLKDESGNVYAVKFTLGEGWEVTVAVDGYKGVLFRLSDIHNTTVSEYFIDYGQKQTFLMDAEGVVDYVMQIPDGWRVTERVEEVTGHIYVDVTAPTKETVEMGAAVASGPLKVVSVVEGGKASVTKLVLSTDPFKTYNVSSAKVVIEPYNGIQKFYFGLSLISEFNEETIIQNIETILSSSSDLPSGYFVSEHAIDAKYEDLYPELNTDGSYCFWIIPALCSDGEQVGYYIKEDMLRYVSITPILIDLKCSDVTLLDAKLKLTVKGTESVYAGVTYNEEGALGEILYQVNNGAIEPITDASVLTYEGLASEFPSEEDGLTLEPNTSYIVWVIPVEIGKTMYSLTDFISAEFKTLAVTEGGSLNVTVSEASIDCSSITQSLSAEDAAIIYYAYLDDSVGSRFSGSTISNATKYNYITTSDTFTEVRGDSGEASLKELMPETTMWLYAVAIGHDGKYGQVNCVSVKTEAVEFNTLSLSLEMLERGTNAVTFNVSVTGGTAEDYIYWVGRSSDEFWKTTCGQNRMKAEKYLAANPESDLVKNIMKQYGNVADDGTISLTGLSGDKEYVLLVLAKDSEGKYSKCAYNKFSTAKINLGEGYVAEGTDKWNETKQWIEDNIVWNQDSFHSAATGMGFASYSFSIKIPTDLTAFISCFVTSATEKTDIIMELESFCSESRAVPVVTHDENGDDVMLPTWVDDNGRTIQGTLFNRNLMYCHGCTDRGRVTYLASVGHTESTCTTWATGTCTNYSEIMATINSYLSLDHWREFIIDFGNYAHGGDPSSEYSRVLQDEENIERVAQAYYDLYYKYYKDAKPILYVNEGEPLTIFNPEASGVKDGIVIDKVTVLLKDTNGNYYDPMYIQVPNYFE